MFSEMLHEKIKKVIKESDYTITDLAKRIGCARENLSKFINQKADTISVKKVDKLCKILNLDLVKKI